jgi:hypothetical protein
MKIFFNEMGGSSTAAELGSARLSTGGSAVRFTRPFVITRIPVACPSEPRDINRSPAADYLLDAANHAYKSLSPRDRHEMDVWDGAIGDGLDDEY